MIRNGSLWNELRNWFESGFLLGAGSPAGSDSENAASEFGIVQGHAYAILAIVRVDDHCLLRLRNPWGRFEWTGKFSDDDDTNWTARLKKKVGFVSKDDGSFWIDFASFVQQFEDVYVCRFFDRKQWVFYKEIKGQWKGSTHNNNIRQQHRRTHTIQTITATRLLLIMRLLMCA